jgi:hypothetical protein
MPAVRVTRSCRVYFNYAVEALVEGQEVPAGEFADFLLAGDAPVVVLDDGTPDVDGDGVPDGTAKDVTDWVGDDPDRAVLALAFEQARDKPRTTLVAALEKLIQPPPPIEPTA